MLAYTKTRFHEIRLRFENHVPSSRRNAVLWEFFLFVFKQGWACLFGGTLLTGSQHNDAFEMRKVAVHTVTNRSGGVQGGISNGEPIFFRVAFKPTATIAKAQKTVTREYKEAELAARGRHDPCVLPRAVPMVEAMAALVLCDHALRQAVNR